MEDDDKLIIYPRCHPYWIIDGEKIENNEESLGQKLAYTATGHLLPCCWLDNNNIHPEQKLDKLLADEMKLENFDSVYDIITTDIWTEFHRTLIDSPKDSPRTCKKMCGHHPKKLVRNMYNGT